jgi:hypothetical protein
MELESPTPTAEEAGDLPGISRGLADGDKFREELTAFTREAGISGKTLATALKDLETAKLIVGTLEGRKRRFYTFALLQPIYSVEKLQKSHQGNGELTTEERQTIAKHRLDKGKPTLVLGQARWFDSAQLGKARSQYRPNQTMNFYVDPQEGHDDFLVSLALVAEAARDFSPRAAKGGLRDD